ncbi:MAG: glycosidase [Chloroflexota bacterium]
MQAMIAPPMETQRSLTAVPAPFQLHRQGVVMRPAAGAPWEEGGVLNPGGARSRDGRDYYLFPRLVAEPNYSRVGIARVLYDGHGMPAGVERLGLALEPTEDYERNPVTGGGCEDPRVTFLPALRGYVMAYAAYGPRGPRVAFAFSTDLVHWRKTGLARFAGERGVDWNGYPNKDAYLFPEPVAAPDGRLSLVLIDRPMYGGAGAGGRPDLPRGVTDSRYAMWVSFLPLDEVRLSGDGPLFGTFAQRRMLIAPTDGWQQFRLGGGTPPVRTPRGWLTLYHGVAGRPGAVRYSAGALVLDPRRVWKVLYRSPRPILEPLVAEERRGVVADVVFPTAVDERDGRLDVYYGMADQAIGVASMDLPGRFPIGRQGAMM